MLFNSYPFLLLLVLTFLVYYIPLLRKFQILILIIASFVFYAYHKPILLLLLIISICFNAGISWLIAQKHQKKWLIIGVVFNLGLLFFFKYASLILHTFLSETATNSNDVVQYLLTIPLPIGISFYTFEGISLVVDTFRGKAIPQLGEKRSFWQHLMATTHFVSFFPHLIAGPILKAHHFYPQIKSKFFSEINWQAVYKNSVIGFFLKMVVADNLKEYTVYMSFPYFENLPSMTLILLLLGYSVQIFADFAGYSLIAIGIGQLFGYELPQNFNYPYIAQSFSEFWQRWHISLSTWLREYLYIPLGGNRLGNVRTYINLFLVMFLGGLWHGAGWNYAIWGVVHGVALAIERFFETNTPTENTIKKYSKMLVVFTVVTIAWLFFRLSNFNHALLYLYRIASNYRLPFVFGIREGYLILFCLPVFLYHAYYLRSKKSNPKIEAILLALMLFLIFTNSGFQGDFIYFQF